MIEGILFDFDGVISKSSIKLTYELFCKTVNEVTPFPEKFLLNVFEWLSCLKPESSLSFFLSSIGANVVEDRVRAFFKQYKKINKKIHVDDEFYSIVKYCEQKNIKFKIFSSATPERLKLLDFIEKELIIPINSASKAEISIYSELQNKYSIDFSKWFIVDDTPLVIRAAKMSGLKTVLMENGIYSEQGYKMFEDFIDYRITSFMELKLIIDNVNEKINKSLTLNCL